MLILRKKNVKTQSFPLTAWLFTNRKLTRRSSNASLQPGTACADLVCSTLPHGTHGELEGATGDVLASVLDVDCVGSNFLRDEAHTVGAAASIHDVGVHCFPTGAGHLSCHGLGTTLHWYGRAKRQIRNNPGYIIGIEYIGDLAGS